MQGNGLAGTYRLVACRTTMADGSTRMSYGDDPEGSLIYDGRGHMAVQFGRRARPAFASAEVRGGTADEMKTAFHGYVAYFGTYTVDEAAGTVTHSIEGSLFPNWEGQDQVRFVRLEGDRLTLTTPPLPAAGQMVTLVLEWQRESSGAAGKGKAAGTGA